MWFIYCLYIFYTRSQAKVLILLWYSLIYLEIREASNMLLHVLYVSVQGHSASPSRTASLLKTTQLFLVKEYMWNIHLCLCECCMCVMFSVCSCGGQRSTLGILLYYFWPYVWSSPIGYPGWSPTPRSAGPCTPQPWDFRGLQPTWLFHECWAAEFRSLYFCGKLFKNWFTSPAPFPSKALEFLTRLKSVPGELWAFFFLR